MDTPRPIARSWDDLSRFLPFSPEDLRVDALRVTGGISVRAVYAGGSLVDGYGNGRSDLDLYAVVGDADVRDRSEGFLVSFIRRRHVQYDFVSSSLLERALVELRSAKLDDIRLSAADLKILHRIFHSVPLLGEVFVESYRRQLLEAGFVRLCAHRKVAESENGIQDAYGAWESQQLETAVYTVRTATQLAFDALLCLRGETANNDKWIFPRSVRAYGAAHPLCIAFRRHYCEVPDTESAAAVERYVVDALGLIQLCMDAWYASGLPRDCTGDLMEPGPLVRYVIEQSGGPALKSPHAFVRRLADKVLLYHQGRPVRELSERAAALWICLRADVATPQALARRASALMPALFPEPAKAEETAARLLPAWRSMGYVR